MMTVIVTAIKNDELNSNVMTDDDDIGIKMSGILRKVLVTIFFLLCW